MEKGVMDVNVSDVANNNTGVLCWVGVLKLFGLMVTGTLMFVTVKYHLTSCAQLAYLNYLESKFLMPSIGPLMEPLP